MGKRDVPAVVSVGHLAILLLEFADKESRPVIHSE
jgi:hypothetical protein